MTGVLIGLAVLAAFIVLGVLKRNSRRIGESVGNKLGEKVYGTPEEQRAEVERELASQSIEVHVPAGLDAARALYTPGQFGAWVNEGDGWTLAGYHVDSARIALIRLEQTDQGARFILVEGEESSDPVINGLPPRSLGAIAWEGFRKALAKSAKKAGTELREFEGTPLVRVASPVNPLLHLWQRP